MTKNAAIYARVSTTGQREKGTSLDGQIDACRSYCETNGYNVVQIFKEDVSGTLALWDRPEMLNMYHLAKSGKIDLVICYDEDRWSRNATAGLMAFSEFDEIDVAVDLVRGGSTFTAESQLLAEIKTVISSYGKRKLVGSMTKGKYDRVGLEGKILGHTVTAFGYRQIVNEKTEETTLEIDEELRPAVELMFELYSSGSHSLASVAKELTDRGFPTSSEINPSRRTSTKKLGIWNPSSVGKMLRNPIYFGSWTFGKAGQGKATNNKPVTVEVPAIVSSELWNKVSKRLAYNVSHRPNAGPYPLKSRFFCVHCGHHVQRKVIRKRGRTETEKDSVHVYYRCGNKKDKCVQGQKMHRGGPIEQRIAEYMISLARDPQELEKEIAQRQNQLTKDNKPIEKEIKRLQAEITKEETAMEKLAVAFSYGSIKEAKLKSETGRMQDKVDRLEVRVQSEKEKLEPVPDFDREVFEAAWNEVFDTIKEFASVPPEGTDADWIKEIAPWLEGDPTPTPENEDVMQALLNIYNEMDLQAEIGLDRDGTPELRIQCVLNGEKSVSFSLTRQSRYSAARGDPALVCDGYS